MLSPPVRRLGGQRNETGLRTRHQRAGQDPEGRFVSLLDRRGYGIASSEVWPKNRVGGSSQRTALQK